MQQDQVSRVNGHSPDTFSLGVIRSAAIQAWITTYTVAVGSMCGLHNTANHESRLKMQRIRSKNVR